mmetsp:Transcript_24411/g.62669  ORF Transcript_24411/g.62669 Transcript_24411/m.62669 type:complete len:139 (-) Transcript_24411:188-604(-)|eukprot:jgi/Tetstr1/459907/TSEL_005249.t1
MPAPVWGVAGSVTTAALAYSLWAGGYLGERRSRTKLILDGKHLRWLAEHCSKDFHTKSLVLERCISHAREADAAAVFEVARCGGGKKQKVEEEFALRQSSMEWLKQMREDYEINDVSKVARIVVEYNIQVVPDADFDK